MAFKPASAALTGTIKGHSYTFGGTAVGNELPAQDRIDLPPGGSQSSGPTDQGVTGVFTFHADSRDTSCTGQATGDTVNASCTADIHNVNHHPSGGVAEVLRPRCVWPGSRNMLRPCTRFGIVCGTQYGSATGPRKRLRPRRYPRP